MKLMGYKISARKAEMLGSIGAGYSIKEKDQAKTLTFEGISNEVNESIEKVEDLTED